MRFQALPGFRDFYPEQMAQRRWIERAWHQAAQAAGFQEIDGPVLESLDLFTTKSGDEIVGQLFAFADKGERQVSLRPEMTPSLARMVAARAGGLPKPIKWYCVPQFFRYERPQRGRGREFIQWNVDVVGTAEPAADAEVMAVAVQALERLGLGPRDIVLRLNDRRGVARVLRELEVGEDVEREVLGCIDKIERDDRAVGRLGELLDQTRADELLRRCGSFGRDDAPELADVLTACDEFGLSEYVELDFKIVRGLDYYTGPVWEIFDSQNALRAVAGGGRYDELIELMGGPALPALGFGMGDVVLTELLAERGLVPDEAPRLEVVVVPIGEEMSGPARRVLRRLRDRGVAAEAPYAPVKLLKALRAGEAAGATRAVLVGPDEWADGSVVVRDLAVREDRTVKFDDLE